MMIECCIEVLKGGKPGDRHWLRSDWDPLDARSACGRRIDGMPVAWTDEPRRITCLACREALVLHVMAST